MPQRVTVDPGPNRDSIMPVDELESGTLGILVTIAPGESGMQVGEPVMRLGSQVGFLRSGVLSQNMEHRVRPLRSTERITFSAPAAG